jgi:hypothetical protein
MPLVLGYLRQYHRWNGEPGLTIRQQKVLVRKLAKEKGYEGVRSSFFIEDRNGESRGWPDLTKLVRRAEEDVDLGTLAVVPTLDGVQFNLSFLRILAGTDGAVFVCSGWRRPGRIGHGTNYSRPSRSAGWLLTLSDERSAFTEMVERVQVRNNNLGPAISQGIKATGKVRPCRLTLAQRKCGGRVTAEKRRQAAVNAYSQCTQDIICWRKGGDSLEKIVSKLARSGARTRNGRRIGKVQVYRILERAHADR